MTGTWPVAPAPRLSAQPPVSVGDRLAGTHLRLVVFVGQAVAGGQYYPISSGVPLSSVARLRGWDVSCCPEREQPKGAGKLLALPGQLALASGLGNLGTYRYLCVLFSWTVAVAARITRLAC